MQKMKKILFWLASWTWGLPMTLFGAVVALLLLITGHKPRRFHFLIYFEVGNDWGGLEAGPFFVVNKDAALSLKQHEAGHGLQNIILGPLMPIISVWSALRYWYRRIVVRTGKKKPSDLPPYDSIWFEGWATRFGKKVFPGE